MVAVIPAVHKILSYVPFLLVLIDLRYEGKPSQTMDFNLCFITVILPGPVTCPTDSYKKYTS